MPVAAGSSFPLYRPDLERDACGIGLAADVRGRASREIVLHALTALQRLAHRGAPPETASIDGSGILTQIPWALFADDLPVHFTRPAAAEARMLGAFFLPRRHVGALRAIVEHALHAAGWTTLHWRSVPVCFDGIDPARCREMPSILQIAGIAERRLDNAAATLYRAQLRIEEQAAPYRADGFAIVSLSTQTVVYKGLLTPSELPAFYVDLQQPQFRSALAIVHQRFSTNTFAQWGLAQPFQVLAHNGEISTIAGNRRWMTARLQATLGRSADHGPAEGPVTESASGFRLQASGSFFTHSMAALGPGVSDSCSLDAAAQALQHAGCTLPHALSRLVPPAWENDASLGADVRAFYEYQSRFSEPWDGPAAIAFSDGRVAGALLDRNGLRPARYVRTVDELFLGSEAGIFDVPADRIVERGRLGPGGMILVDMEAGEVLGTAAVRRRLAGQRPYGALVRNSTVVPSAHAPGRSAATIRPEALALDRDRLSQLHRLFGFSQEEIDVILRPTARAGAEPIGSVGDDTPGAWLSTFDRVLPDYFRQRFAQVTNPAMDPIREACVMSLRVLIGPAANGADEDALPPRVFALPSPLLDASAFEQVVTSEWLAPVTLPLRFQAANGPEGLEPAIENLVAAAADAVSRGVQLIVLSDRGAGPRQAPIPPLLGMAAVHQGLLARGLRMRVTLIVETGEARDAHQLATLFAYGASAVYPYVALATAATPGPATERTHEIDRYRTALELGLLKIFSKMGVTTFSGYCGGGLFDILGLDRDVVDRYFPGGGSPLGGLTVSGLARQVLERHRAAFGAGSAPLAYPGFHSYRRGGEHHSYNPAVVRQLHRASSPGSDGVAAYDAFNQLVEARPSAALRDLMEWRAQAPIPIEEVEPVEEICRRFFAAAMSVGALAPEAHETIALAMNRLGGRSNSGEGGESPARLARPHGRAWSGSAIKQVASARFGVTPAYLRSADELQIKIAQGSKPGEGGQLPAAKVVDHIAALRYAQPGTTLISPPVHHDIYSIEDLAQLVFDLRAFHPTARISIKLVSAAGVGIVAAGAAKAGADAILISGHDGGTGASPRGSIKHTGLPWELGLAEVQQVLTHHGLRQRVALQVDGGLQRGRDVAVAAALGADEFGFGTAALVAIGCVMARQCHLDTCPAGIATQRADLRRRFTGTPEMLMGYLRLLAADVRRILGGLGLRSVGELVGRADLLRQKSETARHDAGRGLDLTPLLAGPPDHQSASGFRLQASGVQIPRFFRKPEARSPKPDGFFTHSLESADDLEIPDTVGSNDPIIIRGIIRNTDRAVGATLSGRVTARFGDRGLPAGSIELRLSGSAGQSLGAFLVPGIDVHLRGDANDYVGKAMHGGTISIRSERPLFGRSAHAEVLAGNAVLYGATGGHLFIAGTAGDRFAVRNSGAVAVVEGVGDHACEYMTAGLVVVLGSVGRNFGSGMSGGTAYILAQEDKAASQCNPDTVEVAAATADDWAMLDTLLSRHWHLTESLQAAALLLRGRSAAASFTKVTPKAAIPEVRMTRRLNQRLALAADGSMGSTARSTSSVKPPSLPVGR